MNRIYTLLFALTFCCFSINSFSQISYTADQTTGCAPFTVTFTNISTDPDVVYFLWDWNDGTPGYQGFDTSHTFVNSGNFPVFLRAYDSVWNMIGDYYQYVSVPGDPYIYAPDSACPNDIVNCQNYDNVNSWFWDFGDGNSSGNQYASNIYTSPGTYIITLIVNSSCGYDTTTKNINISNSLIPSPMGFGHYPNPACPNEDINHYAYGSAASYLWDFGDGDTSTLANIYHSYNAFGTYPVTLTTTNGCGNFASFTDSAYIVSTMFFDPTAYIDFSPDSVCPSEQVNFWAPALGNSYIFNFGDGSPQDTGTSYYRAHSFPSVGDFTVSVKIFNNCGNDTTYTVVVPVVNTIGFPNGLNSSNNSPACPDENISFNSAWGYSGYTWDYGDGSPLDSTGNAYANHSYASLGTYSASVTFSNACGNDTTLFTTVDITNADPVSYNVSINNNSPVCPGSNVALYTNGGYAAYVWNYGDGSPVDSLGYNGEYRYHTYSSVGSFSASVTIYNNCGNDTTLFTTVLISNTEPIPSYVGLNNSSPVCPGSNISLYTNGGFLSYVWDYGDGSTVDSMGANGDYRYHTYSSVGSFSASVTIYNSCGNDTTLFTTVTISNNEPVPSWVYLNNSSPDCPESNISFNTNGGFQSYVWDFGDGSPVDSLGANGSNNNHTYSSVGTYAASVIIYNSCGNDTILLTTVTISNNEPIPSWVYLNNNSPACPGNNIGFNTSSGFQSYVWDFGDGSPVESLGSDGNYNSHNYTSIGTYSAFVTIYNSCGNDSTLYTTVNITNSEPISNYIALNTNSPACPGGYVNMNLNMNGFNYYLWDYGDGSPIDSLTDNNGGTYLNHLYNTAGIYPVSVTVFNNCGNDTTLLTNVDINTNSPFPSYIYFNHGPNEACPGDNINFNAESGYVSYQWNYGDGSPFQTSNDSYSGHSYTSAGNYLASVTFTNSCGNDTTLTDSVIISNNAYFPSWVEVFSNNSSVCPGQPISFSSNFGNGSSYEWNFGDGSPVQTTQYSNVYHTFSGLGAKSVSLKITNNCGNDTTVITSVNIEYPPFPAIDININSSPACPDQPVTLEVQGGFYKYIWNFGDGSTAYVNYGSGNANHSYSNTGTYIVSVKIFQNCGIDYYQYPNLYKDTTIYDTIVINNNLGFSGDAYLNSYPGNCSGDFSFSVTQGNQSYHWNFGDGDTITLYADGNGGATGSGGGNYISHSYDLAGTYTVSVTIENYCGSDSTVSLNITISEIGHGDFLYPCYSCNPADPNSPSQIMGIIPSKNNDPWNWYNGMLQSVCPGESIFLNTIAGVLYPNGGGFQNQIWNLQNKVVSAVWNYGDGSVLDTVATINSQIGIFSSHIFTNIGADTFSVKLFHQCGNDTTIFGAITVDSTLGFPDPFYLNGTQQPCISENSNFYAYYQSGGFVGNDFVEYIWDFGDGSSFDTTNSANSNHQFSSAGAYTVSLKVVNYCGKDTTVTFTINVVDYKPFPGWSYLNANPTNPCPGESVNLYAEAGWENASYHWNFGDGDTITLYPDNENGATGGGNYVFHSFDSVGFDTASVTITNQCGNDTTLTVIINVVGYKPFPNWVNLDVNPNPACPGDNIYFNTNSGFASYQWDFGDGESGPNYPYVNHSYDSTGTDSAMVTITNFCGNDTTLYKIININGNIEFGPYTPYGQQWYLYGWPYQACPNQNVQFQAPNGLPYYVWDFGDGNIDSTSNYYYIEHNFDTTGTYTVSVTMRNNCGSDTTIFTNVVIDNNVGFSNLYMSLNNNSVCPGQEVQIDAPYGYASYIFDYGDGSPVDSSDEPWTDHAYISAGIYNVGLTIYNYCGLDTTIYAPVNIDTNVAFTYAPQINAYPSIVCPGTEVYFNSESGHESYIWNFDDGTQAQGTSNVKHSFDTLGTYGVEVMITNFCGSDTTVSVNVTVSDTISTFTNMSIDIHPAVSCPGDMVEMSVWGEFSSYFWTFGDGDTLTSSGNKVEHIFDNSGTFNSSVMITNGCGFSTTFYESITINGNAPIDTGFAINIPFNPNCPGDEVFFNIENGGMTYIYNWNFGDGYSDSTVGTGTSHIFADTGTYQVNVTATNGCGNTKTVLVNAEINNNIPPVMEDGETFGVGMGESSGSAGCAKDAVLFWFAGTYDNVWDFGDGSTGSATEQVNTEMGLPVTVAKHIYDSVGTYTASLTLTNSCGNSITNSVQVVISDNILVNGSIFIAPPSGTAGYTTCSSIDMIGTGGSKYSWDFGDGDTITTISPTISHTYSNPGTKTVSVKVTNGCGFSTTYFSTITVNGIGGPDATLSSNSSSCYGGNDGSATVTVNDGIAPFTYAWDVNAGSQTGATATGLSAGLYSVNVVDNLGCSTLETISVSEPTDMNILSSTANSTCGAADGSAEVSISGGAGSPYLYNWSSGSTDSVSNSLSAGNYTVTVTNTSGCSKVGTISVNNGNAASVTIAGSANVSCNGGSDGSINITVSGGTSPYTYLWSDSSITEDLSDRNAGTYSVTVTDANNCFSGQSITISQPGPLSLSTVASNANCGTFNGTATVNPAGGTSPYTYLWNEDAGFQNTQVADSLYAGTYKVMVTDSKACNDSASVVVNNANAPVITGVVSNVSCNGLNNGSITQIVNGGTNPYFYNWSNGLSGGNSYKSLSSLAPNSYTVIITDASGCVSIRNYTITQPGILTATAVSSGATCGNADGNASVSQTGGNTSFTYLWNNGQTTAIATGLAADTFTVTVTDNKGCTASSSAIVTQPLTFASSTSSDSTSCNNGNDGSVSAITNGGNAPYSYNWSNADTNAVVSGLPDGIYSVTITDVNNCTSSGSATVGEPSAISASFSAISPMCVGSANGSASVTISGGTSPYLYNWSTNGSSAIEDSLSAGMYFLTVTDANACTYPDSVTVSDPVALSVNYAITDAACFGNSNGSVNATISGGASPYSYNWDNGESSGTINNLPASTYYVTVTDNNNCSLTDSAAVNQPAQLSGSISAVDVSCNNLCNGTALVTPTGGTSPFTYLWNNGDNTAFTDSLCDGNFSVNISDANNCQASQNITISEPDQLLVSVSSLGTTCGNSEGQSTATVMGGSIPYSYIWSDSQTDSAATALGTGTISVTVTDMNGCTANASDSIVTTVPAVEVCIVTVDNSNTQNEIIWEKPNVNYIDSFRVYRDIVGTYTYIGSVDYAALSKFVDTTNGVNPAITSYKYKIATKDNCGNESSMSSFHKTIHLTTGPGLNNTINLIWDAYEGFDGLGFYYRIGRDSTGSGNYEIMDSVSNSIFTYTDINPPFGALDYMVEVVHPLGGCTASMKVENHNSSRSNRGQAANAGPLTASVTTTNVTGNCDGTATVSASGGVSPYSYQWDVATNNQTAVTATGLCAGNYTVTVVDNNGVSFIATASVTSSGSTLSASASSTDATSGNCDGTATVMATGGISPYTYEWSTNANGQTLAGVTGLCAGNYSVTVSDNVGNTFVATSIVGITGSTLSANATSTDATQGNCDGTATANAIGGTTPYNYLWSNGQNTVTATGLCAGSYTVSVTDNDANTVVASATIGTIPDPLSATTTTTDATQGNCDGTATVTAAGGVSPYNYQWDNNAGNQVTETAVGLCPGNYSVNVSDFNGNTTSSTVSIQSSGSTLSAVATATNASSGNCDGGATVTASGGTSPYTYVWSSNANGQTTETITGLCAGTYSVTVTDYSGNPFVTNTTVNIAGSTLVANAIATSTTDTVNCNGTATVTASGGTSPYSYLWDNGQTTPTATGLCAGNYIVSVTDSDINTVVANATVGVDIEISVEELSSDNTITVYPNPNRGEFTLGSTMKIEYISIFNVLGELVYQGDKLQSAGIISINLTNHGTGVYHLIITGNDKMINKRVIVK